MLCINMEVIHEKNAIMKYCYDEKPVNLIFYWLFFDACLLLWYVAEFQECHRVS